MSGDHKIKVFLTILVLTTRCRDKLNNTTQAWIFLPLWKIIGARNEVFHSSLIGPTASPLSTNLQEIGSGASSGMPIAFLAWWKKIKRKGWNMSSLSETSTWLMGLKEQIDFLTSIENAPSEIAGTTQYHIHANVTGRTLKQPCR